tara:strand:- start:1466 stop:1579 length:114 start_codon:yes stop_codon:yes gene_type:complete
LEESAEGPERIFGPEKKANSFLLDVSPEKDIQQNSFL